MTPDNLRKWADRVQTFGHYASVNPMIEAADAWERDIAERDALRKRVEELEALVRDYYSAVRGERLLFRPDWEALDDRARRALEGK